MAGSTGAPTRRRSAAGAHGGPRRARPARRLLGWVLALAGLTAVAVSLANLVMSPQTARSDPQVGPNVAVNDAGPAALVDARNSPTVARNPTDRDNVVVVHRVDRPGYSAELHWSADGGATWSPTELPLPDGLDRAFAPDAAFGPDGTLYVTYVNLQGDGNVPANLWLSRSDDGGRTLGRPSRIAGELAFQSRLVVDEAGAVHVFYVQADEVALLQFVGPVELVAVRSEDGGQTVTEPVRVSDADRPRVGTPVPAVIDGDLVVVYTDFTTNVRDFQNLEGPPWPEPAALVFTRSTDGGRTFAPGRLVDTDLVPAKRFLAFLPEFPALAAGPDGLLAVAWSDGRNGDEDVFLRRSTDAGRTWADPLRVNRNPRGDGTSQYMAAVAVAPDGRVDVAYLDRTDDHRLHTVVASSTDGARSFQRVRVSSQASDARIGATASPHLDIDFGTRTALTSDEDTALVAWTDTRLAEDPEHGRQDIFAAEITFPTRPIVPTGLLVGGLVAGLGCLAGAGWVLARRPGGR